MLMTLLLLGFGIYALVKGEFNITGGRKVNGSTGRILGILMLADAVLNACGSEAGILSLPLFFLIIGIGFARSEKVKMKTAIPMEGATCVKTDDGSVFLQPNNARNWLHLSLFIMVLLFFATVFAMGGQTGNLKLDRVDPRDLVVPILAIVIVAAAIVNIIRSLRRPAFRFIAPSKTLEIGKGSSMRQYPFSSISGVFLKKALLPRGLAQYGIAVVLQDDTVLELGVLSGAGTDAGTRSEQVVKLVADVTDAPIVESLL